MVTWATKVYCNKGRPLGIQTQAADTGCSAIQTGPLGFQALAADAANKQVLERVYGSVIKTGLQEYLLMGCI